MTTPDSPHPSSPTVPEWRRRAPAGVPLSQASTAALQAVAPASTPATTDPADSLSVALRRIVKPEARARWTGFLARDYTPERIETILRGALWGDHVSQWELFTLMEDTWPRLNKALQELKRAVTQMDWRIEPWAEEGQAPTQDAELRARLVSRAIWTMRPRPEEAAAGFEATVEDLLDAWAKGVAVQEVEWEVRAGGSAMPRMIAPKATHWVHPQNYLWTDAGELALRISDGINAAPGLVQTGSDSMPFPPDKFLIGVCKARSGPALGGALLRPLAWWWTAANFSAGWLLNLAQVFGLPIRWASYAPGSPTELVDKICAMLENMGSNAWAAFPAGTQIELKEPTKGGGQWPQDSLLDRADRQVDLLILGQTLTTTEGQSGTMALGSVHKGIRDEIIQAAADWVATVLNQQLVPSIVRMNFGTDTEAPEFCPKREEARDLKADADRICQLLDRSVPIPRDWLYRSQQIPLPQEGEEVITGPARAAGPLPESPRSPDQPPEPTAARRAVSVDPRPLPDTASFLAGRKAAALAQAFRGAMAPVRQLVEASNSREDLERLLAQHYADWPSARIAALVEEALQIVAAAGAAEASA